MKIKEDRGAAAVEFALVLIPLLLIVFGLIDFGRAFYTQISLDHIAREGVRTAALGDDPTADSGWVTNLLGPAGLSAGDVFSSVCGTGYARVEVSDDFEFLTPLAGLIPGFPGDMTLTGVGEAKCYG